MVEETVTWMPAHTSKAIIGRARKSNGAVVTPRDWRTNRLVDALAKAAAGQGRVEHSIKACWAAAAEATEYAVGTLGMVTHAANNCKESALRPDESYVLACRRDACPMAFLDGAHRPLRRTGRATGSTAADAEAHTNSNPEQKLDGSAARALTEEDQQAAAKAAWARTAKARAAEAAALNAEAAERRFTQSWRFDKTAASASNAAPAPSAQDRLEALRLRVRARAALREHCG